MSVSFFIHACGGISRAVQLIVKQELIMRKVESIMWQIFLASPLLVVGLDRGWGTLTYSVLIIEAILAVIIWKE